MPCPFCIIAANVPPSPSPAILTFPQGSAYPVLSTPLIIAFLDIAPLSPGHVLVCPRTHCAKSTDMSISETMAAGFWLPVLARAVLKAVGSTPEEGCWNIIQANGTEAGQTVPHSHFHIIPRVGDVRGASDITDAERKNIALGEGPRVKLDDAEGRLLVGKIQEGVREEIEKLRQSGDAILAGEGSDLCLKLSGSELKL